MVNNEKTKPSGKLQSILLLVVVCFLVAIPTVSAFNWTNLVAYYKLDETSGTTVVDSTGINDGTLGGSSIVQGEDGIINTGYYADIEQATTVSTDFILTGTLGITGDENRSISAWIKYNGTKDLKVFSTGDACVASASWDVLIFSGGYLKTGSSGGSYDSANIVIPDDDTFHHIAVVYSGGGILTGSKLFVDGNEITATSSVGSDNVPTATDNYNAIGGSYCSNSPSGMRTRWDGFLDEVAIYDKALSSIEISELYNSGSGLIYNDSPTITLIYPVNDTIISDVGINFSVSGKNLSSISANWTNVTYNIWYDNSTVFNSTTVDFTDNETFNQTLIFGGFTNGNYMWNAEACYTNITGSSCISAIANYTFEWRPFEIISQSYNEYVYETDRQRFNITINTLPEVLNVDTNLNYNGTLYSATTSCASGFCNIYSIIDIPLITSGESINRSLFWSITVYDGTGTYTFNTSDETKQQNITRIHLEECAGAYTTTTVNFTAYYETNLTRINPFYIASTFDTWLGSGAIYRTQSFNKESTSELKLCITPTTKNQYSNAQIDYKFENENITFILRNYFFQNKTLTNISEEINLFLLEAEDSTSFIIKVQDQKLSPVVDALVYIQKYYPSDGEYRTVQIARTDSNGETIGFYETETVDYKHIIIKNGETLLETAKQKVVGKSVPFTLTFTIGTSLGFPWTSFEDNQNVSINLTFDKDTNIVTMTYIENITGSITSGQLLVIKNSLTNSTTTIMCNKTSTEASVTLTCDLSAYDGTFTAIAYINGGSEKIIEFIITDARDVFGSDGLFLGMMIIMVGGFAMMWNPSAGIVSINAAVIFVNLIGFITVSPIFIFGMISVSVITIILLKT